MPQNPLPILAAIFFLLAILGVGLLWVYGYLG